MRILLDESIPRRLGFALPGHFVRTVQLMGWSGLVNGKLLATASSEFDVLITGDQNMQYQQSANQLPMSVVVLIAPNNKLESFLPLVGKLLSTLDALQGPCFIQLDSEA
jgi:predicted nuclease of predicted toxin-antitoxin system